MSAFSKVTIPMIRAFLLEALTNQLSYKMKRLQTSCIKTINCNQVIAFGFPNTKISDNSKKSWHLQ